MKRLAAALALVMGLALVGFGLPFFLLSKPLVGQTISMTEVGLVLVALAVQVLSLFGTRFRR